jgi:hypothetical protein
MIAGAKICGQSVFIIYIILLLLLSSVNDRMRVGEPSLRGLLHYGEAVACAKYTS